MGLTDEQYARFQGIGLAAENRWAAFTDDELKILYARIEDSERIGNLKSGGPRLAIEIQSEIERRGI